MLYSITNKKMIFSLFSIISFQILLTLVQNSITQIDFPEENSFIIINEDVIFVNDSSNAIKKLGENSVHSTIGTHNPSIEKIRN